MCSWWKTETAKALHVTAGSSRDTKLGNRRHECLIDTQAARGHASSVSTTCRRTWFFLLATLNRFGFVSCCLRPLSRLELRRFLLLLWRWVASLLALALRPLSSCDNARPMLQTVLAIVGDVLARESDILTSLVHSMLRFASRVLAVLTHPVDHAVLAEAVTARGALDVATGFGCLKGAVALWTDLVLLLGPLLRRLVFCLLEFRVGDVELGLGGCAALAWMLWPIAVHAGLEAAAVAGEDPTVDLAIVRLPGERASTAGLTSGVGSDGEVASGFLASPPGSFQSSIIGEGS